MKRIYLMALLLAGALGSCSKNEIVDVAPTSDNQNKMSLALVSTTSKGEEATTTSLHTNAKNINLEYYSAGSTDVSYDSNLSTIPFTYSDADDMWAATTTDGLTWSDIAYDAYFYSFHNGTSPVADGTDIIATVSADGAVYTAQSDKYIVNDDDDTSLKDQKDLIYYRSKYTEMPYNAIISGTFDHALSRVEFYPLVSGYTPYLQVVRFVNIKSQATKATIAPSGDTSSTLTWEITNGVTCDYLYANNIVSGSSLGQVSDAKLTSLNVKDNYVISESLDGSENPAASDATNILMLPQTCAEGQTALKELLDTYTTDPVPGATEDLSDDAKVVDLAYIEKYAAYTALTVPYVQVLYRMRDGDNKNSVVGFQYAKDAAYFDSQDFNGKSYLNDAGDDWGDDFTPYPEELGVYDRLYALVGFPFSATGGQEFAMGYDYDIYLGFNTTGGILLYDYYFTSNGEPTNIPVMIRDPGETILPTGDSELLLSLTVNAWSPADKTTL